MAETDRQGSRAVLLGAAYGVGVVGAFAAAPVVVAGLFGGAAVLLVGGAVLLAVGVAALAGAASAFGGRGTGAVTGALGHRSGRLGWALWVGVAGTLATVAVALLWGSSGVPYPGTATYLLAGIPFAAAAALTLPGLPRWLTAAVLVATTAVTGVLVDRERDEDRFEAAVRQAGPRELLRTVQLPGYTSGVGTTLQLTPVDQTGVRVWQERDILLQVEDAATQPVVFPGCGPAVMWAPQPWPVPTGPAPSPSPATCTPEGPGLWYRQGDAGHGYVRVDGGAVLRADAGPLVPRALVRQAVTAARPPTDADVERYLVPERGP